MSPRRSALEQACSAVERRDCSVRGELAELGKPQESAGTALGSTSDQSRQTGPGAAVRTGGCLFEGGTFRWLSGEA